MTTDTRRAGAFLVALSTTVAVLALLAGPAGAQTVSGGANASNGSVASGTAQATNGSDASGSAVANNGSTASGCSTANNQSTTSGGPCPTTAAARPAGTATATPAAATAARLALTGSWTAPMLAMAALAMAFGAFLLVSTSNRRRAFFRA